ncbi:hypothetical protein ACHWQZ_G004432 [Mnemiopsis leidyi]
MKHSRHSAAFFLIVATLTLLQNPVNSIVCYKCQEFQYLNGTKLGSEYASLKSAQSCSVDLTENCPKDFTTDSCIAFRAHFKVDNTDLELLMKSCAPGKSSCEGITPVLQSYLTSEAEKYDGLKTELVKCGYSPTCNEHDLCNGELPDYDSAATQPVHSYLVVLSICILFLSDVGFTWD